MTALGRRTGQWLEAELQRQALEYLGSRPDVWCMRVNSGGRRGKTGFRGAPKGTADIVGCMRGGRFFGLELKSPRGKETIEQKLWAQRIRELGGAVATVRSMGEVVEFMDRLRKEAA